MDTRRQKWWRNGCPFIIAIVLSGCGEDLYDVHEIKSFSEGATFHISDDALVPYDKIKNDMKPAFAMQTPAVGSDGKPLLDSHGKAIMISAGDAALARVGPTTGYYEQQVVRALSAALAI